MENIVLRIKTYKVIIYILIMDKLLQLYSFMNYDTKKKERFDIILEPLQAVTQLALLSFCPKGSKLTISNNLLLIQQPSWIQGVMRSYNQDTKEDLFFLFNAIIRFNRFYIFLKERDGDYSDLFDLLILLSKRGIDKLSLTYANTDQPALLHTLQLYRLILDKPNLLYENEETDINVKHGVYQQNGKSKNIDEIFINICSVYSNHEFSILYEILLLLEKNNENYDIYINGINTIFTPTYDKIQKWISENIVY